MSVSVNDSVASVMTCNAPATTFYQRAKSLLTVIVKLLCHFMYCHIHTSVFAILMAIFSTLAWLSQYQNVSAMYFISFKNYGDGGDSWSHKLCKAPFK